MRSVNVRQDGKIALDQRYDLANGQRHTLEVFQQPSARPAGQAPGERQLGKPSPTPCASGGENTWIAGSPLRIPDRESDVLGQPAPGQEAVDARPKPRHERSDAALIHEARHWPAAAARVRQRFSWPLSACVRVESLTHRRRVLSSPRCPRSDKIRLSESCVPPKSGKPAIRWKLGSEDRQFLGPTRKPCSQNRLRLDSKPKDGRCPVKKTCRQNSLEQQKPASWVAFVPPIQNRRRSQRQAMSLTTRPQGLLTCTRSASRAWKNVRPAKVEVSERPSGRQPRENRPLPTKMPGTDGNVSQASSAYEREETMKEVWHREAASLLS